MTTASTIVNACRIMQSKAFRMQHLSILAVMADKKDPIHTPEIEERTAINRPMINTSLRELQVHGLVSTIEAGRGAAGFRGTQA